MAIRWIVLTAIPGSDAKVKNFDDEKQATTYYASKVKEGLPPGASEMFLYLERIDSRPAGRSHTILHHYFWRDEHGNPHGSDFSRIVPAD
jgi:hypothetical protein